MKYWLERLSYENRLIAWLYDVAGGIRRWIRSGELNPLKVHRQTLENEAEFDRMLGRDAQGK